MTPEGRVKAKVKAVLKPFIEMGSVWVDWPVPGGYGKSGLDCHGCVQGAYFAIETKAHGKHPTVIQQGVIKALQNAGADVFVIGTHKDRLTDELLSLQRYLEFQSAGKK